MCCGTFKSLKRLPYWSNYYNTSLAVIILSEKRIFNFFPVWIYVLNLFTFLEYNVISNVQWKNSNNFGSSAWKSDNPRFYSSWWKNGKIEFYSQVCSNLSFCIWFVYLFLLLCLKIVAIRIHCVLHFVWFIKLQS